MAGSRFPDRGRARPPAGGPTPPAALSCKCLILCGRETMLWPIQMPWSDPSRDGHGGQPVPAMLLIKRTLAQWNVVGVQAPLQPSLGDRDIVVTFVVQIGHSWGPDDCFIDHSLMVYL